MFNVSVIYLMMTFLIKYVKICALNSIEEVAWWPYNMPNSVVGYFLTALQGKSDIDIYDYVLLWSCGRRYKKKKCTHLHLLRISRIPIKNRTTAKTSPPIRKLS